MSKWDEQHRAYSVWKNIMVRCGLRPSRDERLARIYSGVSVCAEWMDFYAFEAWLIDRGWKWKSKMTLCRVDKSGDFSPSNCIVTTNGEAQDYRRNVTRVRGVSVRKLLGLPPGKFRRSVNASQRIRRYGWSAEDALNRPVTPHSMLTKLNLKRKEQE